MKGCPCVLPHVSVYALTVLSPSEPPAHYNTKGLYIRGVVAQTSPEGSVVLGGKDEKPNSWFKEKENKGFFFFKLLHI